MIIDYLWMSLRSAFFNDGFLNSIRRRRTLNSQSSIENIQPLEDKEIP